MEPGIDLKHFRYFLAVATDGTFTGAAAQLQMTQPALSRAIRGLEDTIGTALFKRNPQGVELTEAGRLLSHDARGVVELADTALTRLARFGHEGLRLRISSPGCDVDVLHRLVDCYNERHPDQLRACGFMVDPTLQPEQLRTGQAEVALLRGPFDDRGLDSDVIRSDPRVVLLPESHPLAGREQVHRSELSGEAFPIWPGLTPSGTAFWTGTDLADYTWRPGPVVRDAAQFVGSIRLGQAIGFIADAHLPELSRTGIKVLPVIGLSHSELRIAWSAAATSSDLAQFIREATYLTRQTVNA